MNKQNAPLIKVIRTIITDMNGGQTQTEATRRIMRPKQGQVMADFVADFLQEQKINTYELHRRSENVWAITPILSNAGATQTACTYNFLEFMSSELAYQAKDLTKAELERDMKKLKNIIYG